MTGGENSEEAWLERFHAGERGTIEQCYRDHFSTVRVIAIKILSEMDAETVTQDVFLRLLSNTEFRLGFSGGNFGAWIGKVTRNAAIDYARRRGREVAIPEDFEGAGHFDESSDAAILVEAFIATTLPLEDQALFQVRFIQQMSQRDAGAKLGMQRSTLAYREDRIRKLLTQYLLSGDP